MSVIARPAAGFDTILGAEPIELGWLDRHPSNLFMVGLLVVSSLAVGAGLAIRMVMGFAVLVAVAMLVIILRRPAMGGYVLVGLVPITSGFLPGVPVPHLRISEVLIVGISAIVLLCASGRQALPWRALDFITLVYVVAALGIGGVDIFRDHDPTSIALYGTLAGPLQFFLLYRAVAVSLPQRAQREIALRIFILASIPVSVLAVLQQLRINGINSFISTLTGSSIFQSYAYHSFARATGPFDHWTPLAGYLLVVLLVTLSLVLHGAEGILSRRMLFFVLGLDVIGLLLSAELSAMAALIIGGLALGVWSGHIRLLMRWAVPITIVAGVTFGSYFVQRLQSQFYNSAGSGRNTLIPQTLAYRWQVWTQQYFPAIRASLIHGYGPVLPSSITWQNTESQYITYLMWGGIPLLLCFVGMMWALYRRSRALCEPSGDESSRWAVARTLVILIIALYPIDTIFPYFTSSGLPQAFWVLVGLLLAAEHDAFASRPNWRRRPSVIEHEGLPRRALVAGRT